MDKRKALALLLVLLLFAVLLFACKILDGRRLPAPIQPVRPEATTEPVTESTVVAELHAEPPQETPATEATTVATEETKAPTAPTQKPSRPSSNGSGSNNGGGTSSNPPPATQPPATQPPATQPPASPDFNLGDAELPPI